MLAGAGWRAFEVGDDVRDAFLTAGSGTAFQPGRAPGKWLANLPLLARLRLRALGITTIHTAGHCTYSEPEHFWSYRRSTPCGRMAGLIWLTADRFHPPTGTPHHRAG